MLKKNGSLLFSLHRSLTVFCGSPSYVSPEIVNHKPYTGPTTDVWSLGVLIFGILVGYLPFYASPNAKNDDTLDQRIMRGRYRIPSTVSPQARDLLKQMIVLDPHQRITTKCMLDHPWLVNEAEAGLEDDQPCIDEEALAAIESILGHQRINVLQAIIDNEISDVTSSYYLLSSANKKRAFSI